jgi:hypothetical protein
MLWAARIAQFYRYCDMKLQPVLLGWSDPDLPLGCVRRYFTEAMRPIGVPAVWPNPHTKRPCFSAAPPIGKCDLWKHLDGGQPKNKRT